MTNRGFFHQPARTHFKASSTVYRSRFEFCGIHCLFDPHPEEVHGHNYILDITLSEDKVDLLNQVMQVSIIPKWHKKNWNKILPSPTMELVAENILHHLLTTKVGPWLLKIRLQETPKNIVEILAPLLNGHQDHVCKGDNREDHP